MPGERITANALRTVQFARSGRAPFLAIALDDETGTQSWSLTVEAEQDRGPSARLGTVQTLPYNVTGGRARVVAVAYCPGAIQWYVTPTLVSGRSDSASTLTLSADEYGQGAAPLVATPGQAFLVEPRDAGYRSGPAASGIIYGAPTELLWLFARNGHPTATLTLQLWDLIALPAAATATTPVNGAQIPIVIPPGGTASIDSPVVCSTGLVWTESSTPDRFTAPGTPDLWVQARHLKRG
jgi:hypothetical protein